MVAIASSRSRRSNRSRLFFGSAAARNNNNRIVILLGLIVGILLARELLDNANHYEYYYDNTRTLIINYNPILMSPSSSSSTTTTTTTEAAGSDISVRRTAETAVTKIAAATTTARTTQEQPKVPSSSNAEKTAKTATKSSSSPSQPKQSSSQPQQTTVTTTASTTSAASASNTTTNTNTKVFYVKPPPKEAFGKNKPKTIFSYIPHFRKSSGTILDEFGWPIKQPNEIYGNDKFNSCSVVFKDPEMATCHLGAFNGNFGDMIGPDIVKRLVEYYYGCDASNLRVHDFYHNETFPWLFHQVKNIYTKQYENITKRGRCLMTVGSVWREVRKHDHVWGTGMVGKISKELQWHACHGYFVNNNVTVYSVRGPNTVGMLHRTCETRISVSDPTLDGNITRLYPNSTVRDAGDGGFLIPYIFPELTERAQIIQPNKTSSCIILHQFDDEEFKSHELINPTTTKKLPVIQNWKYMIQNITRCDVVSSSSLHGLLIADAYGIPSRWIGKSGSILPFKYDDYFKSYGITKNKFRLYDVLTKPELQQPPKNNQIARSSGYEIKSTDYRAKYATRILESFPFHLFTTTISTTSDATSISAG